MKETKNGFGSPVFNEKGIEINFPTEGDRYLKHHTFEVFNNVSSPNVLQNTGFIRLQKGVPRSITLDQANCLLKNSLKTFVTIIILSLSMHQKMITAQKIWSKDYPKY